MTIHYIRYHKEEPGNSITSRAGKFEAWAEFREKQPGWKPPVTTGDIVWVISGKKPGGSKSIYRLENYFKVAENPVLESGRFVVRGSEGKIFDTRPDIGHESWFSDFFVSIGRGGTSFQKIQGDYLPYFLGLFEKSLSSGDRLDGEISASEKSGYPDDEIQFRAIKTRRGQPEFRQKLLSAYESRCCFSGCNVIDVLEAAHIKAHADEPNYSTNNGLLMRADLHTLFDLHLIGVDEWGRIKVSKNLNKSDYQKLDGERIRHPSSFADSPSQFELAKRLKKLVELDAKE
ncbi:MAG: HNH endonuclease signature motif containing protein [Gallionella sp.]